MDTVENLESFEMREKEKKQPIIIRAWGTCHPLGPHIFDVLGSGVKEAVTHGFTVRSTHLAFVPVSATEPLKPLEFPD